MMLTWNIRLLSCNEASIPLTTVRTTNRGIDGSYPDSNGSENYFVDLGAHQGESIAGFAAYCALQGIQEQFHITSYEPSRQAQIWAPLAMTANQFCGHYKSMYIGNYAVSSKNAIQVFRDDGSAGSSLHQDKPLAPCQESILVPTISIIDIISSIPANAKSIVIKLNVEGAEYDILSELVSRPDATSRITELFLDFHGHQFQDKYKYLSDEIRYLNELRKLGVQCSEIDFMRPFYYGHDKNPLIKTEMNINDRIKKYNL
jgi:FkbM family methyltransferase